MSSNHLVRAEFNCEQGQYVVRFDSAGTELDLPPGATANIQGQSLVLPEGREGGLTLDQRAMVSFAPSLRAIFSHNGEDASNSGFEYVLCPNLPF